MLFSVDERLFEHFPELKIGCLVCEINNTQYNEDNLEDIIRDLKLNFPFQKPQEHPNIKVWRDAFNKLGISASKYYSSVESLLRRALKGGPFPRINPVVDLYNAVSLKHLVPMGGHAISPLKGDIALCFANGGEFFVPMDSNDAERVDAKEVVYKDSKEVLTRRWVWRQCNKDKVTEQTASVFIPIDVMPGLSDGLCETVMADMEQMLVKNRYGKVLMKDILTKTKTSTLISEN
ncbi:MAG TPA: phenylalanine--tRNA ligase beta subunit-related protein [Syntrophorhabdaceae bacterium]|nr:phenylalanine--tRNA ligase beta subunit-related protein [Syntrophorhabdaceae bacterium]